MKTGAATGWLLSLGLACASAWGQAVDVQTNNESSVSTSRMQFATGASPATITVLNARLVLGSSAYYNLSTSTAGASAGDVRYSGGNLLFHNGSSELTVANTSEAQTWTNKILGSGSTWNGNTIGVGYGGTGTSTQFTAGSVVFAGGSGVYSQDNTNFFWDDTNNRLGIGTSSPGSRIDVAGGDISLSINESVYLTNSSGGYTMPYGRGQGGQMLDTRQTGGSNNIYTAFSRNLYYDPSADVWKKAYDTSDSYYGTSQAIWFDPSNNAIKFITHPAGGGGQDVTVTPNVRMTIDTSGNVGVGTAGPSGSVHVVRNTAGTITGAFGGNSTTVFQNNDGVTRNQEITFVAGSQGANKLWLSDGTANYYEQGWIRYNNTANAAKASAMFLGTNNADRVTIDSGGLVGVGTSSPGGRLHLAGNVSAASWTTSGIQFQAGAATYTNTSTAASGTAASAVFASLAQPTLAATNASVTTTEAATFYVAAAPAAGSNMTITSGYALWADAGRSRFDGGISIDISAANSGTTSLDIDRITNSVSAEALWFRQRGSALTITGSYGTQRFAKFDQPTITAGSALTVTDSATLYVEGQPLPGGSAVITNAYSLWVDAGAVRFDGDLTVGGTQTVTGTTTYNSSMTLGDGTGTDVLSFSSSGRLQLPKLTADDSTEGRLWYDDTNNLVKYYNGSAAYTVVNTSESQTLTNKTLGSGNAWNGNLIGVGYGGTGTTTTFTQGSVVFAGASGVYSQDNSSFFWDDTNNRLGIGDATPDAMLDVEPTGAVTANQYAVFVSNLVTNSTTDGINKVGVRVDSSGSFSGLTGTATNNWGLYVTASGADNNYGAYIADSVGIGTTTPGGKLQVTGTTGLTNYSGIFRIEGSTNNPGIFLSHDESTGQNRINFTGSSSYWGTIAVGGTDIASFRNSNVGVGTTNPQGKLHVVGGGTAGTPALSATHYLTVQGSGSAAANAQMAIVSGNAGIDSIDFGDTDTVSDARIQYDNSAQALGFQTAGVGANDVTIDSAGKVGIGTTGPSGSLHVVRNTAGTITGSFGGNSTTVFQNNDGVTRNQEITFVAGSQGANKLWFSDGTANYYEQGWIRYNNTANATKASAMFLGTNNADRVTIDSSGYVGIGTPSPGSRLDVSPSTYTGTAGASERIARIQGAITEAGSGNHPRLMGVEVTAPTITGAAATVSDTATFYVSGAMSATVSGANYALWVDSGNSRFDGIVESTSGGIKFPDGSTQTSAAAGTEGGPSTSTSFVTDEFANSATGELTWTIAGSGSNSHENPETGRPGVTRIYNAGAINEVIAEYLSGYLKAIETFDVTLVVKPDYTNSNVAYMIGLSKNTTAASAFNSGTGAEGVYVRRRSGEANWQFVTSDGASETVTDSGVAIAAGTWFKMRIRRVNSTTLGFSINGGSETTHTATLPADATVLDVIGKLQNTDGTGTKSLYFDYFQGKVTGLSR